MVKRSLLTIGVIVAVVGMSGIGFASFATSAFLNGSATAGTLGPLTWSNLGTPTTSASYNTCTVSTSETHNASDTLVVTVGNLAPGDYCTISGDLSNAGSIPANVYSEVTCYAQTASGCTVTSLYDNFAPAPGAGESYNVVYGPITVTNGAPLAYSAEIQLSSGIGNSYQGSTCTFTVAFTATAGS